MNCPQKLYAHIERYAKFASTYADVANNWADLTCVTCFGAVVVRNRRMHWCEAWFAVNSVLNEVGRQTYLDTKLGNCRSYIPVQPRNGWSYSKTTNYDTHTYDSSKLAQSKVQESLWWVPVAKCFLAFSLCIKVKICPSRRMSNLSGEECITQSLSQ